MNILIVEDDQFKLNKIENFLQAKYPDAKFSIAKSLVRAKREVLRPGFTFAILDMSLPTFDVGAGESGGRPQVFGGAEVFRYMDRKGIRLPTIVLTQFERFGKGETERDISTLGLDLSKSFDKNYIGLIYFDTTGEWKVDLEELLDEKVK